MFSFNTGFCYRLVLLTQVLLYYKIKKFCNLELLFFHIPLNSLNTRSKAIIKFSVLDISCNIRTTIRILKFTVNHFNYFGAKISIIWSTQNIHSYFGMFHASRLECNFFFPEKTLLTSAVATEDIISLNFLYPNYFSSAVKDTKKLVTEFLGQQNITF